MININIDEKINILFNYLDRNVERVLPIASIISLCFQHSLCIASAGCNTKVGQCTSLVRNGKNISASRIATSAPPSIRIQLFAAGSRLLNADTGYEYSQGRWH
ncbi:hypothetical protein [Erwinia tracheiphila]|uniref:hypothetical protein n=1 Tax=Erwinia tracheiphila TaxID=65700 RepID=UPI000ABE01A7|nr:hypothetical protein [Erwinia tracheiphila]